MPPLTNDADGGGGVQSPRDEDARARLIEEASLRAWPAHADSDFDGWRLRFADGYTRRANSITPLGPSRLVIADKIATCERLYAARGLPAIFRMTPFAPPDLDAILQQRGYRMADQVEVRALAFRRTPAVTPSPRGTLGRGEAKLQSHAIDAWLDIFGALSGAPPANRPAHRAVLNAVPGARRLLALWVDGRPVACGMTVLCEGLMGLFDLVTAAGERNRGYGSELLTRALATGARKGASQAYLQVLDSNRAAQRIYQRAGFEVVYRYHYREPR